MSLIKKISFQNLGDTRGDLVSLEGLKNIPFEIKRVYYLVNTKNNESRGFHAHKKLKQVLICLNGSCRVRLDDGDIQEDIVLSSPSDGIILDSLVWREMHDFSNDCVLLVLASDYYDEEDYIRNYNDFFLQNKK